MDNLKKSVRVLTYIFDIFFGADVPTSSDRINTDYLNTKYKR